MNRSEYLSDRDVTAFVEWSASLVTGKWRLQHCWSSSKLGPRRFESLFDAYEKYCWPSKFRGRRICSFSETQGALDVLQKEIRAAITAGRLEFKSVALEICRWGGHSNTPTISKLSEDNFQRMNHNTELLDPRRADTRRLSGFKLMRTSYSKIYSLMINDFPIYDARVACALTSLIWLFCLDTERRHVPSSLCLGVPEGRNEENVSHNPSADRYQFPNIRGDQHTLHALSNVKAAWILGAWTERGGKFSKIPQTKRTRAMEAALFMLGYQPLNEDAVVKDPNRPDAGKTDRNDSRLEDQLRAPSMRRQRKQ